MAVLIGSATVKELYERVKGGKEDCEKAWDDNSDTANMNELMPGDIDGGTAQDEDVLKSAEDVRQFLGKDGQVIVRKSGTEPLIKVKIMGVNYDEITQLNEKIRSGFAKYKIAKLRVVK